MEEKEEGEVGTGEVGGGEEGGSWERERGGEGGMLVWREEEREPQVGEVERGEGVGEEGEVVEGEEGKEVREEGVQEEGEV